jgi:hypothetical protein
MQHMWVRKSVSARGKFQYGVEMHELFAGKAMRLGGKEPLLYHGRLGDKVAGQTTIA